MYQQPSLWTGGREVAAGECTEKEQNRTRNEGGVGVKLFMIIKFFASSQFAQNPLNPPAPL